MDDEPNSQAKASHAIMLLTLSAREREVVQLQVRGLQVGRIAVQLGLSVKTISTYRTRALLKLRIKTTAELMRQWYEYYPKVLESSAQTAPPTSSFE